MSSRSAHVRQAVAVLLATVAAVARLTSAVPASSVPVSPVTVASHPALVTFGIDPRDYSAMAGKLAESALRSPKLASATKAVLVIGPVDTDACAYPFDQLTLQEKLQTALHQAGRLEVSFAVNALPDPSAQVSLVRLNQFNFEKNQAEAGAELRAIAATANIDFLLFGRLSARETLVGSTVEVTYVFNWKIGDCRSGLLVWSEDFELTKRGPAAGAPMWFDLGKTDTPTARFATGSGAGATDPAECLQRARMAALAALADRTNRSELADPARMRPVAATELAGQVEVVMSRNDNAGGRAWIMVRLPQTVAAERVAARTKAYAQWRTVAIAMDEVLRMPREQRRQRLAALRKVLAGFDAEFPPSAQPFILLEPAALDIAEFELALGNPWAARRRLAGIAEASLPGPGVDRLRERLAQLPVEPVARETYLLRRELEGRVVRLRCAWTAESANHTWPKAAAELQRWLEQYDAIVQVFPPPTDGDLRGLAEKSPEASLDLLFQVSGELRQRSDGREPPRPNHAFEGDLWSAFRKDGRWHYPVSAHVATGWTIFGSEMTLDLLALEAVKQWRRGLTVELTRVPDDSL